MSTIWNLEEFFKNKDECLKEIDNLKNIYERIKTLKNISLEKNLFIFLEIYDLYQKMQYELLSYFELLEASNYRNPDLRVLRSKFKQIDDKICETFDEVFSIIIKNRLIEKYKSNKDYEKYSKLIENYGIFKSDSIEKHINTFNTLMNDITSSNTNILNFSHTFIEIINNYFKEVNEALEDDSEDYIYYLHEEIEKEDLKKLLETIKQNSNLNDNYYSILLDYIPKKINISFEEARKEIIESFNIFGTEYRSILKSIFSGTNLDYEKRKYKTNSDITYMISNHKSFASINYEKNIASAFTLAHELGHMVSHDIKYKHGKTSINEINSASELFSLTNEIIFGNHLLKKANTLDEKIAISKELINLYYANLFETSAIAELTLMIANKIKTKSYIDLKTINSLSNKIIGKYNLYNKKGFWINNEILNNIDVVFYIYGIIGASNIYNSIQTKTFSVSDYIEVLAQKNEGPDSFAIFDKLGCNPCHEENIRKTFENYNNLLENTKDLIYEKKLKRRKNGI